MLWFDTDRRTPRANLPGTVLAFSPIQRGVPRSGDGQADGRRTTPIAVGRRHPPGIIITIEPFQNQVTGVSKGSE
jgi:hypothetical protein